MSNGVRCWAGVILASIAVPPLTYAQARPSFPITMQQAARHAADHYPAVAAARARLAARESGIELARLQYLPRVDSSLQINRATRNNVAGLLIPGTILPGISGPASAASSATSFGASAVGLLVAWEAVDFGARAASVKVAEAYAAREGALADLVRIDTAARAADAFLRLAAAEDTARAAGAAVARQEVFARVVAALVASGLRPGADDSRARAELAAARVQLAQAEQAVDVGRALLAQWLGVAAAEVRIVRPEATGDAPPFVAGVADPAAHPLARAQQAAVTSSRALQDVIGRSYAPRIALQGSYSRRGSGASAAGLADDAGLAFDMPNWAVGVTASFPVLDWFSTRERQRIEGHHERAESATYERVVREIGAQEAAADADVAAARRIAAETPAQLEAARALETQARARYQAGLATIVEVADAERLLLQAEVTDALARLGVWRAFVAAAAARGDVAALLQ
ncbi:MAG: TolC family protein [Acidobacteriota bacterium]